MRISGGERWSRCPEWVHPHVWLIAAAIIACPAAADAATYYVRTDGGSATRCTGLANAADPGSGTNQACAWDHPFRALPPGGAPRIAGGDTLMIAAGSYMMGYGAPGADSCDAIAAWDCYMPPVPSGPDTAHPTKILGAGSSSGCASPPQLWGTERADQVINLTDSSNVQLACLEITDRSGCVESHSGGLACTRDTSPYGQWAVRGIYAEDSTSVLLQDLDIHGLGTGIQAGRLTDWTLERVRIAGNGWSGWDGDIGSNSSNSGNMVFKHVTVEWNGCAETYPGLQPAGCWSQSAGGYGDGLGTGGTSGNWLFEDSVFRYNTSDGLDLLYARVGSSITIRRTLAKGNAGNQLKTNGPATIENSIVVGNCAFFDGKTFTHNVDNCRAAGNSLSLTLRGGDAVTLTNNTVTGEGDCLVLADCDTYLSTCVGTEAVRMRNNLFAGNTEFLSPTDLTCLMYQETFPHGNAVFNADYSLITGVKDNACPGTHDICGVSPGLVSSSLTTFDANLLSSSPAINAGTATGAPTVDFDNRARDSTPDIGAYEYRSANAPSVSTHPSNVSVTTGQTATFTAAASGTPTPTVQWQVSTDSGTTWTNVSGATSTTYSFTTAAADTGKRFRAVFTNSAGSATTNAATLTVGGTAPTLTPSPASLNFGAVNNGGTLEHATPAQTVTVQQSGGTGVGWTASANVSWLTVVAADAAGTGTGQFTVALNITGTGTLPATGTVNGTITITAPGAASSPTIPVRATLYARGGTTVPFGLVDTPLQNTLGVVGTIGVTGWVLDDVGVTGVKVYRNCLAFEPPGNCVPVLGLNLVFVGDATLVAGARPDVEAIYPTAPLANRAAWGYLLLTNLLPHVPTEEMFGGQGPVTLHAVARDAEGQEIFLGRAQGDTAPTSITMNNDAMAVPFGAIDTPAQGATVGGVFANFGWALTPDANTSGGEVGDILVPVNGSTLRVYLDGVAGAFITYNQCRGTIQGAMSAGQWCDDDVASIFGNPTPRPVFTPRSANPTKHRNLDLGRGAIGALLIDTTTLANGVHTIMWGVTDSAGRGEGLGSRYFTVLNARSDQDRDGSVRLAALAQDRPELRRGAGIGLVTPSSAAGGVRARTGFSLDAPYSELAPDAGGVRHVQLGELDRLELQLGAGIVEGYLVANGQSRPLPVGSHLDVTTGTFTWAPGVGFFGTYRLAFGAHKEASFPRTREPSQYILIDVTIRPPAAPQPGEAAIRMSLDLPRPGATVSGAFLVAGWALDPQAAIGAGIGAIHVWAQRTDVAGAAPVFLGAAALDGPRPDVAGIFGAQFGGAGYNLAVGTAGSSFDSLRSLRTGKVPASTGLVPGIYDLTAYVWSTRTARWEDARTVRVIVR